MTPSESLSIAQMAIYPPILLALIFVLVRHGISKQSGFVYLASFCIIRMVGAGFGIAAGIHPTSITDQIWSAILGSIGIFSLLGATGGLLKRIIDETSTRAPRPLGERSQTEDILRHIPIVGLITRILTKNTTAASRRSRFIQFLQLPATAALIICIIGGTDLTSAKVSDQKEGKTLLKAGVILFLIIYLCLVALAINSATEFNRVPMGEKRILAVVLAALPLLAVRFLWVLLAYFSNFKDFQIYGGSVIVRSFMSNLEEMLIVIAYTFVGLMIPKYGGTQDPEAKQSLNGKRMQGLGSDGPIRRGIRG